jgi:hypothetical protein
MKKLFFLLFITTGLHSMTKNPMVELEIEKLNQELEKNKIKLRELYKDSELRETLMGVAATVSSVCAAGVIAQNTRRPLCFVPIFFMTPIVVGIPTALLIDFIRPTTWYYEHKQLLLSQKLYNLKEKHSQKRGIT